MTLSFFIPGIAKTAGSKRAFVLPNTIHQKPNGKWTGRAIVTDDCVESRNWKTQVRFFAGQYLRQSWPGFQLMTGPLKVKFTFYRSRPQGHSGTKGLNKNGRDNPHPVTKPDVDKLSRAIMDALTSVVWNDDAQVVTKLTAKRWGQPGVVIQIEPETEEPKETHDFVAPVIPAAATGKPSLKHPFDLPF